MTRLNLVLLMAVLASALYLVRTQYESRRLFVEIDKAHAEARRLEVDNERLQVEKREQATPARVQQLAQAQLKMRTATPAITQYVTLRGGSAGAAAAGGAPASGRVSQPVPANPPAAAGGAR